MTINIAILSSTRASHLDWLYQLVQQNQLAANVCAIITDRSQAPVLTKAYLYDIPAWTIPPDSSRQATDVTIHYRLQCQKAQYVFLIGYKRRLSNWFCAQWRHRLFNIHPSLLPKYQGLYNMAIHQAVIANQEAYTGCTLHEVTQHVDQGRILHQQQCAIDSTDTAASLKHKVYELESKVLYNFIQRLSTEYANYST